MGDKAKKGEEVDLNFGIETIEDATENMNLESNFNGHSQEQQPIQELDISADNHNDNNDNDNDHDDEEKIDGKAKVSTMKALFGDVKKYEYPQYVPPIIDLDDYFNVDRWRKRRMDALSDQANRRKKKATTAVLEDR